MFGKFSKAAMIEDMGQELMMQDTRLKVLRDSLSEYIKKNTDLQYQLETKCPPLEDLGRRSVRIVIGNSRELALRYHNTFEVSFEPKFEGLHGYVYGDKIAISRILHKFGVTLNWTWKSGLLTKTFTELDRKVLSDMDEVEADIQVHLTRYLEVQEYGDLIQKEVHTNDK